MPHLALYLAYVVMQMQRTRQQEPLYSILLVLLHFPSSSRGDAKNVDVGPWTCFVYII